ncbi:MAG TPA: PDZ domain-containing protein [Pirellulaceae bacterium]|nr:PDZ domain-containing protein [Pirellulaceae bacterium]HMO93801.1 PDZ domain-containing protein [Pirellulaceae bacterium]HMP70605.1 PDZ domain-containing protein [Pirellulaceae bacterium]
MKAAQILFVSRILFVSAICILASDNISQAQQRKVRPYGTTQFNESQATQLEGQQKSSMMLKGGYAGGHHGGSHAAVGPGLSVQWILGITDMWFDYEGLNIEGLAGNSPLLRLRDRYGRSFYLERGDVITAIDGIPIRSFEDYLWALQDAQNPRNLRLTVINCRDGQYITLYGSAMKRRW